MSAWAIEPGARRILNAVHDSGTSAADRERLMTLILEAAPAAARQILEDLMATTEWKNDFVESFVNVGIEKGSLTRTRAVSRRCSSRGPLIAGANPLAPQSGNRGAL